MKNGRSKVKGQGSREARHQRLTLQHSTFDIRFAAAQRHSTSGFTLAESMFAMAIVSFVLLTIIGMLPSGLNAMREAERRSAEARICQTLVAEYESAVFNKDSLAGLHQRPIYFDDSGAEMNRAFDITHPTHEAIYVAQVQFVREPQSGPPMASHGFLPGEEASGMGSASPYLSYLKIAVTNQVNNPGILNGALKNTAVPLVRTFTVPIVNMEAILPLPVTPP